MKLFTSAIYTLVLVLFIFLITSCERETKDTTKNTVNPVIGDDSWIHRFGSAPTVNSDEFTRVQTHLMYAEEILRSKDVNGLDSQKRAMRIHLLDLLHEYWANGKFPFNSKYPDERRPCFIDDLGTICAVGYLVEKTAGIDVAKKINEAYQYATISEMNLPELREWISNSGLTLEEVATIQPSYHFRYAEPEKSVIVGAGMANRGIGPGYPSFMLGIDKNTNSTSSTFMLRYESLGPFDNQLGLRFGYATRLIRNHTLGIGITPSFFLENNQSGANLKPDVALSLLSGFGSKGRIGLMFSYGYDFALSNKELFPVSRHDLALHLLVRFGKDKIFRDH